MVYLFITIFGIIFLFCFPFKVGINIFSEETPKNIQFSITLLNFVINGKKLLRNKRTKNKKSAIKINFCKLPQILKMIVVEQTYLEVTINNNFDPAIYFTIQPLIDFFNCIVVKELGVAQPIKSVWCKENKENYFQMRIAIKINFHIIFSAIFQILKIDLRRKRWK